MIDATHTHELKVNPQFWDGLESGNKPFEIRRNDRKFSVGDVLVLRRYDPAFGYSGEQCRRVVTYVLASEDLPVALMPGYVALGLSNPDLMDDHR